MAQARQEIILNHSQFYRDGFRKIVFMIFVLMIIAYALLAFIIYQHINRPTPQYFVTTSAGRLIEITSVGPPGPVAVAPVAPVAVVPVTPVAPVVPVAPAPVTPTPPVAP